MPSMGITIAKKSLKSQCLCSVDVWIALCQKVTQQSHKSAKRLTTFRKKVVSRLGFPSLNHKSVFHIVKKIIT
jgi:hypothetical protein